MNCEFFRAVLQRGAYILWDEEGLERFGWFLFKTACPWLKLRRRCEVHLACNAAERAWPTRDRATQRFQTALGCRSFFERARFR